MTKCLICENNLSITALSCEACQTEYSGRFIFPRLARLSREEQELAEILILHGGNLKMMARSLDISYPTLKKRLNELSDTLKQHREDDKKQIEQILKDIELGSIGADEGIKQIWEINGEL